MSKELNILNEMSKLTEASADTEYMLVIDYSCLGLSKSSSESEMKSRVNEYLSHVGQKKSNDVFDAEIGVGIMYSSESEVRKVASLLSPVLLPGDDMQLITYVDDEPLDDAEVIPVTNTNMVDMSPDDDEEDDEEDTTPKSGSKFKSFYLRYSAKGLLGDKFSGKTSLTTEDKKSILAMFKKVGLNPKDTNLVQTTSDGDVLIEIGNTTQAEASYIAETILKQAFIDPECDGKAELYGPFDGKTSPKTVVSKHPLDTLKVPSSNKSVPTDSSSADSSKLDDFAIRYSAKAFIPGFKGNSIRSKEAKEVVAKAHEAGVSIKADQVTNLDYNDVTIMLVDTTKSKVMDIAKKLAKSLPKDEKWYKNVSKGIEVIGPFDSTLEDDDDEGGMAEAPVEVVAITSKDTVTESVTDAVLESLGVAKDTIGVARSLSESDSKLSERLDLVLESMDLIMKSVDNSPKKMGLSELVVTPDVGLLKVADSHEDIHGLAESLGFSQVSDDSYELEGESSKLILESASGDVDGVVLYGMTSESEVLDKDEFNSMLEELDIDIVE